MTRWCLYTPASARESYVKTRLFSNFRPRFVRSSRRDLRSARQGFSVQIKYGSLQRAHAHTLLSSEPSPSCLRASEGGYIYTHTFISHELVYMYSYNLGIICAYIDRYLARLATRFNASTGPRNSYYWGHEESRVRKPGSSLTQASYSRVLSSERRVITMG